MTGFILYDREGIERNRWFASAMSEYAKTKGVSLDILIRENLNVCMESSELSIVYNGKRISSPDFVINRCIDPFVAECFELAGTPVFNSASACRICNDKRLTHMTLSAHGIKMTDSLFASKKYDEAPPIDFPCIVKSAEGHGGSEVFMANNISDFENALLKIESDKYLIQKPAKTLGRDLRVYVMGGKILCSVLRSCDSDFRSNFSLGGNASLYEMTKEQQELVYKILSIIPLTFAGIDFIFDGDQMLLNEIEDIVGSRMIYSLTDIPVHELLVDTVLKSL